MEIHINFFSGIQLMKEGELGREGEERKERNGQVQEKEKYKER